MEIEMKREETERAEILKMEKVGVEDRYLALVLREKCAWNNDVLHRRGLEGNIKGNCGRKEMR